MPDLLKWKIYDLRFHFEGQNFIKHYCSNCEHIFSNNLKGDVKKGSELFNYETENENCSAQDFLLMLLEKKTRKNSKERKLLDFGTGGNYSDLINLNKNSNLVTYYGCNIYNSNKNYYFQCYSNEQMFGSFDGISSVALIEHLDNTIFSWEYFNKLLKPSGVMLYAFPSQITEDLLHWAIRIRSHECLFSTKSLNILCNKIYFKLIRIFSSYRVQHPIYYFKKIRDL